MKNFFENEILKDLYEIRCDGFEFKYTEKYGNPDEMREADEEFKKLENIIKEKIKDKNDIEKVMEQIDDFQYANMKQYCFWFDKFYKVGFVDGINLKKEIEGIK